MNKPWLKNYPPGVPATVDTAPYTSVVQMIEESMTRHADRPAITSLGTSTSFGELDRLSRQFAAWLQAQGVLKGDRVALMMPNLTAFPVAALGTLRAGATMVTVNPLYTPRELAHQLKDSGARVLVLFEAFAATVQAALPELALEHIVLVSTAAPQAALPRQIAFTEVLKAGADLPFTPVALTLDDLALLQYTGGTTGVSKGAMLTHRNLVGNVLQIEHWLNPIFPAHDRAGRNIACLLPLYHIFALTVCMFYGLRNGLHNRLVANPRDLAGAAKELGGAPIHMLPGVNTMFATLPQHPQLLAQFNLTELRIAIGGGSAVQQGTADRWQAATGVPICEGYGLSETSSSISCNVVTAKVWSGTVGLPFPGSEIAIRDDDNHDMPFGERGEICVRGIQVTPGYWQRPDETAQSMTPDGFFKTGDIGIMDEGGYVRIVDRKKDMILVSGFNVFPNEIEDVVSTLPGVLESAAIGVPDERSGEAVKLFVVRSDSLLTSEAVQAHCRSNLTAYKNPKIIEFIDALPKSTVGKVLRRELRV